MRRLKFEFDKTSLAVFSFEHSDFASVSEPFGLSAVEAVQQGAASVISKRSDAAEVLTNSLRADFWDTDVVQA